MDFGLLPPLLVRYNVCPFVDLRCACLARRVCREWSALFAFSGCVEANCSAMTLCALESELCSTKHANLRTLRIGCQLLQSMTLCSSRLSCLSNLRMLDMSDDKLQSALVPIEFVSLFRALRTLCLSRPWPVSPDEVHTLSSLPELRTLNLHCLWINPEAAERPAIGNPEAESGRQSASPSIYVNPHKLGRATCTWATGNQNSRKGRAIGNPKAAKRPAIGNQRLRSDRQLATQR